MEAAVSDTSGRFESPCWFVFDVKGVDGLSDARPDRFAVEPGAVDEDEAAVPARGPVGTAEPKAEGRACEPKAEDEPNAEGVEVEPNADGVDVEPNADGVEVDPKEDGVAVEPNADGGALDPNAAPLEPNAEDGVDVEPNAEVGAVEPKAETGLFVLPNADDVVDVEPKALGCPLDVVPNAEAPGALAPNADVLF
ncbi:hypothetical protein PHSY_004521 [Pseudozyma hubeiensis SY62]|uniref:Uncharacterized protein n=1 Tax=Pseudozyma hubeiensis (strain SY62) TaxID=1305764 RepID=R9P6S5_PSEHS|nr:hypothetical protein PHSY_004521 [Pseudozyma hubeiensis SY62]GAC96937.1 hypothetical protein PHSY_004521 [Pseudozyma hubeiensis SY62]